MFDNSSRLTSGTLRHPFSARSGRTCSLRRTKTGMPAVTPCGSLSRLLRVFNRGPGSRIRMCRNRPFATHESADPAAAAVGVPPRRSPGLAVRLPSSCPDARHRTPRRPFASPPPPEFTPVNRARPANAISGEAARAMTLAGRSPAKREAERRQPAGLPGPPGTGAAAAGVPVAKNLRTPRRSCLVPLRRRPRA